MLLCALKRHPKKKASASTFEVQKTEAGSSEQMEKLALVVFCAWTGSSDLPSS